MSVAHHQHQHPKVAVLATIPASPARTLKGRVSIAGVGSTAVGRVPGKSAFELSMDAAQAALDDAGLRWADIDGLYTTESRVDAFSTAGPMALVEPGKSSSTACASTWAVEWRIV